MADRDRELERREQLERALREAVARAEAASEAKSRFLANMSHELRTPLNAIIGYAEILMEDVDVDAIEDLERIRSSGRHLLGLINDVLDLSKIEAGKLALVAEEIDVGALVAELRQAVAPLVPARRNTLLIEVHGDVPPLLGDPMRVRQVLLNLLSNALKFTEGGTVRLDVRCEEQRSLVFAVRDTGIGIGKEQFARLFRPFVQADDSTSRRYGGTGLGLALSQRLAQMMEGEITVRSEVGEGSTFTFSLPLRSARAEVLPLVAARIAEARGGERPTVLCVDDDPATLLLLDRMLARHPVVVVPCLDPERVVPLAVELSPVAITLDLHMPKLDGQQVLQRLRAQPEVADVPVVVVSVDPAGSWDALQVGHWLTKPVDRAELLGVLAQVAPSGDGPVLVVDDDADARQLVLRILEQGDVPAVAAAGGAEALALLDTLRPRLVVLDLMLPEVDGFAVVERLRAEPRWAEIPVVVLTAAAVDERDAPRLASCTAIVRKGDDAMRAVLGELERIGLVA
ncbi:MAG: response regulator [Myxococcota bacterium]